jgi:hypothetical protein
MAAIRWLRIPAGNSRRRNRQITNMTSAAYPEKRYKFCQLANVTTAGR